MLSINTLLFFYHIKSTFWLDYLFLLFDLIHLTRSNWWIQFLVFSSSELFLHFWYFTVLCIVLHNNWTLILFWDIIISISHFECICTIFGDFNSLLIHILNIFYLNPWLVFKLGPPKSMCFLFIVLILSDINSIIAR